MSEALRLAEILEGGSPQFSLEAAAELRQLSRRIEGLDKTRRAYAETVYAVHDALGDAGWHPGRTDDLITDVIKAKGQEMRELQAELRRLHAENEALRADAARLDSGMILMSGRDSWGEDCTVLHKGVNLRAAIDAARKEST